MLKIKSNLNNSWFLIEDKHLVHWEEVKKSIEKLFKKYGSWEYKKYKIKTYNDWVKSLSQETSNEKEISHSDEGLIIPHFDAIDTALNKDENDIDLEDTVYSLSVDLIGNVYGISYKMYS